MGHLEPSMRSFEKNRPHVRKRKQRGSQIVEYTLAFIPMLMFMFLILDVAWAIYSRATLQYAVAQGLRYAVTSQTGSLNGVSLGQIDSIRAMVQKNAFGKLGSGGSSGTDLTGWNSIQVHFYLPNGTDVTGVTGGNGEQNGVYPLVEVSVESFSQKTFMPTIRLPGLTGLGPIVMSARAWDRMEAPPMSGVPPMGNP
jgi:Flp pilus assembly protein TadG